MVRTSPKADLWISPEAPSGRYGSTSVLWRSLWDLGSEGQPAILFLKENGVWLPAGPWEEREGGGGMAAGGHLAVRPQVNFGMIAFRLVVPAPSG